MKTKALVLGSLAALGILIGVALIASAAGAMDEGLIPQAAEGTPAMERVQKTLGALIRDRARLKDCSCGECEPGSSEEPDSQEEQERSGTRIQDRDRDQTNGGNGAQNRNSGN